MRYGLRIAMMSGMVALLVGVVAPAHAERESLAGHWRLTFYGKCVDTPQNRQACRDLQSPATFAVVGVPGSVLEVRGTGDYVADARGHYTVKFVTVVTEMVPGAARPVQCTNALVFDSTYGGTCREVGTGHGHIARGHSGMSEFWQDDAAGWWVGPAPARFTESSTVDTMNPACPGTYDTKRFLKFFGYTRVPTGITARLVLTHTSR